MPLTTEQEKKLNEYLVAFSTVWQAAGDAVELCRRIRARSDDEDPDLQLTNTQKQLIAAKLEGRIAEVVATTQELVKLKAP